MQNSIKSNIVLFLGGARSGKSTQAEKCASHFSKVLYFATAKVEGDEELQHRVKKHVERRPDHWITLEPPSSISDLAISIKENKPEAVLFDCATLWLSTIICERIGSTDFEEKVLEELNKLTSLLSEIPCPVFIVSNETGLGLVPNDKLSREFRDFQGILNCKLLNSSRFALMQVAGKSMLLHDQLVESDYRELAVVTDEWIVKELK